ncbi:MAG: hypothetical protein JRN52_12220 [Nitrososphaerota archaeon]|nr:hypothetical protein [Nitrososphaerota archaeon]
MIENGVIVFVWAVVIRRSLSISSITIGCVSVILKNKSDKCNSIALLWLRANASLADAIIP